MYDVVVMRQSYIHHVGHMGGPSVYHESGCFVPVYSMTRVSIILSYSMSHVASTSWPGEHLYFPRTGVW